MSVLQPGYVAEYRFQKQENIVDIRNKLIMPTPFAKNQMEQAQDKLPQEEKYRKVEYYPSDKFDEECSKYCKNLWLRAQE